MNKNSPMFIDIGQGLSLMVGLPTIPTWDSTTRPQNARTGTFGFNQETNSLECWDGKNWWATIMLEE